MDRFYLPVLLSVLLCCCFNNHAQAQIGYLPYLPHSGGSSPNPPEFAPGDCGIVIDWDHTANCGWNIFNPQPCAGFCDALRDALLGCNMALSFNETNYNASEGGTVLCHGSRRRIDPDDWNDIFTDCFGANHGLQITPQGQNGCPEIIDNCGLFGGASVQCRIDLSCESGATGIIDSDCPPGGTATCSDGSTIACVDPGNPPSEDEEDSGERSDGSKKQGTSTNLRSSKRQVVEAQAQDYLSPFDSLRALDPQAPEAHDKARQ